MQTQTAENARLLKRMPLYTRLDAGIIRAELGSEFLGVRVLAALDMVPSHLAHRVGQAFYDVVCDKTPDLDAEIWCLIADYVDERLAGMLALKGELARARRRRNATRAANLDRSEQ